MSFISDTDLGGNAAARKAKKTENVKEAFDDLKLTVQTFANESGADADEIVTIIDDVTEMLKKATRKVKSGDYDKLIENGFGELFEQTQANAPGELTAPNSDRAQEVFQAVRADFAADTTADAARKAMVIKQVSSGQLELTGDQLKAVVDAVQAINDARQAQATAEQERDDAVQAKNTAEQDLTQALTVIADIKANIIPANIGNGKKLGSNLTQDTKVALDIN